MKVKAFFSNGDTACRLEISHPDGHLQHVLFENTSSLVGYCRNCNINVTLSNCHTED